MEGKAEAIKVLVRIKPQESRQEDKAISHRSSTNGLRDQLGLQGSLLSLSEDGRLRLRIPRHLSSSRGEGGFYHFNFESLAGPDSSQEEIFETIGREACEAFLDGFNAAIFAYGQTGSGKTHTMYGSLEEREGAGLIPRSLEFILGRMQQNFSCAQHVALRCCLLEIYNEQVIDLLVAESRPLQIRERMDDGVTFAEGACSPLVRSLSEALELLRGGIARRRVGATCANECSSRSHCILSLFLDVREEEKAKMVVKTSALHLVSFLGPPGQWEGACWRNGDSVMREKEGGRDEIGRTELWRWGRRKRGRG